MAQILQSIEGFIKMLWQIKQSSSKPVYLDLSAQA